MWRVPHSFILFQQHHSFNRACSDGTYRLTSPCFVVYFRLINNKKEDDKKSPRDYTVMHHLLTKHNIQLNALCIISYRQ